MSKTTKIIAALGVVAGLGVAALPAFTYAADPVDAQGDVQVLVEVLPAIAMQITGNNDDGTTKSAGTFTPVVPENGTSLVGYYSLSGGVYTALTEGTADGTTTYYQYVTPTYGQAKSYSPTGATTIDGQALTNFDLDYASNTSSSYISLLPNSAVEGDISAAEPTNRFGSIITVWTNNNSGYNLTVGDKDSDTNLTHSTGAFNIPTGAGAVSGGTAKWNFDTTVAASGTTEALTAAAMPAHGSDVTIDTFGSKTSGGRTTKVDYNVSTSADQATGIYSDTIVYTATTNN